MVKRGSNGKVTAKKVYSIGPSFEALPLKLLYVINDDANAVEESMPIHAESGEPLTMSQLPTNEEAL